MKNYELSNHLGNVLAVVNDRKEKIDINGVVDHYEATVISASDYYPFGLNMPSRTFQSTDYRYGFNGKEKDQSGEWGDHMHYDYGFRIYNPEIARFLSVDPLTYNYPDYSPYMFAGNKPIVSMDLDGLEELIVHSAFWTEELANMDICNMTEEQIMDEVVRINNKGYKNKESAKHANDYYQSNGNVVSIVNVSGPLKLIGYTDSNAGEVMKVAIYNSDSERAMDVSRIESTNNVQGGYHLIAPLKDGPQFGKLPDGGRAQIIEVPGAKINGYFGESLPDAFNIFDSTLENESGAFDHVLINEHKVDARSVHGPQGTSVVSQVSQDADTVSHIVYDGELPIDTTTIVAKQPKGKAARMTGEKVRQVIEGHVKNPR